jgi:hypothetical protein
MIANRVFEYGLCFSAAGQPKVLYGEKQSSWILIQTTPLDMKQAYLKNKFSQFK